MKNNISTKHTQQEGEAKLLNLAQHNLIKAVLRRANCAGDKIFFLIETPQAAKNFVAHMRKWKGKGCVEYEVFKGGYAKGYKNVSTICLNSEKPKYEWLLGSTYGTHDFYWLNWSEDFTDWYEDVMKDDVVLIHEDMSSFMDNYYYLNDDPTGGY